MVKIQNAPEPTPEVIESMKKRGLVMVTPDPKLRRYIARWVSDLNDDDLEDALYSFSLAAADSELPRVGQMAISVLAGIMDVRYKRKLPFGEADEALLRSEIAKEFLNKLSKHAGEHPCTDCGACGKDVGKNIGANDNDEEKPN